MAWYGNLIELTFPKHYKKHENVDLHPARLAGRAAAGQPGGVQVHILIFVCMFYENVNLLGFHTNCNLECSSMGWRGGGAKILSEIQQVTFPKV